jgi:hypothetical protein
MNIDLPKSTLLNKFIPKNIFFKNSVVNSKLKAEFTDKIQKITWKYKISEETLWINKTDKIQEIEIFEINLKEKIIPKNVLKVIDKSIPYPILYIFIYEDDYSYWITLKWEKIWNYYFSDWNENIEFEFNWIDIERVFEDIIKKFLKNIDTDDKKFDEIIETDNARIFLEKDIEKLKNKIKKEKQFNKKVELNKLLLEQKSKLEQLT